MLLSEDISRLAWHQVGFVDLDGATVALGDPARIAAVRELAEHDDVGVGDAVAWLVTHDDFGYPVEGVHGAPGLQAIRVEMTNDLAELEADGEGAWHAIGTTELRAPWLGVMDPFRRRYDAELAALSATAEGTRWFGQPVPVGCALPWPPGIHGVQVVAAEA